MEHPTKIEVKEAYHQQICEWYVGLPMCESEEQRKISDLIAGRFVEGGGLTEEVLEYLRKRQYI